MRWLAIIVGALIIGAATHVTIEATGGYGADHAPLAVAIACGVIVGAICVGRAFAERRWILGAFITVALLSGEAWAMLSTAERIIAGREKAAEPARDLEKQRAAAQARLDAANAAPEPSAARLEAALQAKARTDASIAADASKKTCAANCKELLSKAANDAAAEVTAARRELDAAKQDREKRIAAAAAALEAVPPAKSEAPLADRLGLEAWALDLIAAALASLSANGLGAGLIAYGAHGTHGRKSAARAADAPAAPAKADKAPLTIEAEFTATQEAKGKPALVLPLPAPKDPKQQAAKFGLECLQPDVAALTPLGDVQTAYFDWCAAAQTPPLPTAKIAAALAALFADSGLDVVEQDGRLFVRGIKVAAELEALRQTGGAA